MSHPDLKSIILRLLLLPVSKLQHPASHFELEPDDLRENSTRSPP